MIDRIFRRIRIPRGSGEALVAREFLPIAKPPFHFFCMLAVVSTSVFFGLCKQNAFAGSPVTAVFPVGWSMPKDCHGPIDFALSAQADAWLRHGVLGDPSFDSFQHRKVNPIVRGKPPFNWPVNGFLFKDPKSGNWYAYIGHYLTGYDLGPNLPPTHCRVNRSKDQGETWEELGPIFDDPKFHFEGNAYPANIAPDVSVVFADNQYHLVYDWLTDNSRWADAHQPPKDADSGLAYACAERPEGPYHRASRPIIRTSEMPHRLAMGEKYNRAYGATILRREKDWLVLALVDSNQFFGWGLIAMTATDPVGAWSDPIMVLGVESDGYFPATVESFPAMVHDGYIYASSTSVAMNRDFQVIYRAKLGDAHRKEAWQLFQHGTAWHSEPVPQEEMGIWGQTYSGFVDCDGQFQVLFPSRERLTNLGTINLATRPWATPLRERSFSFSGHQGRSLTLLRYAWNQFQLKADLTLSGNAVRLVWGYQSPLGPDRHASDATVHPLSLTNHQGLEISADAWRMVSVDATGRLSIFANGPLESGTTRAVEINVQEDGNTQLAIDGKLRWDGKLPSGIGPVGLLLEPFTNLNVSRFELNGPCIPATLPWLSIEALTGAAVDIKDWEMIESPLYRFGIGALRKTPGGRVKWNFRGRGFRLWSPQGPNFGRCELLLDGRKLSELDFHAEQEKSSSIVYSLDDAGDEYHAVVLHSLAGRLVVDALDAVN